MGYCIDVVKTNFLLKSENEEKALKDLKKLAKKNLNKVSGLSWVDEKIVLASTNLKDAMKECRWELHQDCIGADFDSIEFTGEKYGKDFEIFNVLAPYVENGSFIEVVGEDGEHWRWVFNDGELYQINPTWDI